MITKLSPRHLQIAFIVLVIIILIAVYYTLTNFSHASSPGLSTNPITLENKKAGTTRWQSYQLALSKAQTEVEEKLEDRLQTRQVLAVTSSPYSQAVLTDQPLAFWRLDEATGTQATDTSGNNYNGVYSGGFGLGATGAVAGDSDSAISSNGTAKVTLPTLPAVTNFSIEGWSYLTDSTWNLTANYNNALYGKGAKVRLLIRPGAGVTTTIGYFGVTIGTTEYSLQPSSTTISNLNQWAYWVLTRNANVLTLYRNGIQISQRTDLPATTLSDITGQLLTQDGNYYLKGSVDDVAIYNKALSLSQIQNHYSLATAALPSPTPTIAPTPTPTPTPYVMPEINGYANAASINHGENINFYVSTVRPSYQIEVYRMGWYGGTGSRLITTITNLPGQNQAVAFSNNSTGLIENHWNLSYTLQTGTGWVTGVYLAKLIADDNFVNYIPFVVRDDSSTADILYQIPFNTYQAYNNWGGKSLYDYNSTNGRAYQVSYDRPYQNWSGAGNFFDGDYNLVRFLESKGYNIAYATSTDTQTNPQLLSNHKAFVTNFHDEYWSKEMRDNITAARDLGKNLAFLSANSVYWQVRFDVSTTGQPNRILTCYKDAKLDPLAQTDPVRTTINFRDPPVNLPENALLGGMYESLFTYGSSYPWVVQNSNNWIYAGTNLSDGQQISGLVGYEYDKIYNNGQTPVGLMTLGHSPVVNSSGASSFADGTLYTAPSSGLVFNAGTNYWSWKLDDNTYLSKGADSRVQQMTVNLLNKMAGIVPTAAPTVAPTPSPTITPTPAPTNLILNPSFETTSLTPWSLQVISPSIASVSPDSSTKVSGTYSAVVNITKGSTTLSNIRLYQSGLNLVAGRTYNVSFWAKAASNRQIQVVISSTFSKTVNINKTWQQISFTYTPVSSDSNGLIGFNLASTTDKVWLDDISLK